MKNKKEKKQLSFVQWMIKLNFLSIVIVGLYMAINTGIFVGMRTNSDYREIATATSVNVAHMLDTLSDADYAYDEATGILTKGDVVISDAAFIKSQEFDPNIHHTIFWDKTRVLTDVKDESGNLVIGTKLTDDKIIKAVETDGIYTDNNVTIYGSKYSVCYYPIKNSDKIVGYVFTGVNQDRSNKLIVRDVLAAAGVTAVLAFIIIFVVVKLVRKKSLGFNDKLGMILDTTGEKRAQVSGLGKDTNENMTQIVSAISQMSQAITQQAGHTEDMMGNMRDFGDNLDVIMSQVNDTSVVTKDSSKIIDEMKLELEELEKASKENSDKIADISEQIEEDNREVANIRQIVNVINDIAFQITILSFNASVEAARAGTAGRGFAVVAGSINELSDKTKASVNDIAGIIEAINNKMQQTGKASAELIAKNNKLVEALAQTKERMNLVTEAFNKIAEDIDSIAAESSSIVVAKNHVVETLSSLAATSEENAAMSEQITSTSNVVISATNSLLKEINGLSAITDTVETVKHDFID